MSNIEVRVTPAMNKLAKAYKNASKNVVDVMRKAVEEFSFYTERYSKQVTPVDTGRLRGSISTEFPTRGKGMEAWVGTHNVSYAKFVHEGTWRMKARPFMKHGVEFAQKKYTDREFANKLDNELRLSLSRL